MTLLLLTEVAFAAYPAPLTVAKGKGAVAADTVEASRAGADVLAKGGNAVDAAVASALAVGVVSMGGSGLGGGGFLVYWSAKERRAYILDFREVAPKAATRDMFVSGGKVVAEKSRAGGLSVAVPGEPAGLAEVERRFGKLGLKVAAAPAIRLARDGYKILPRVAKQAEVALPAAAPDDPLAARLRAMTPGAIEKNLALAKTLEAFAAEGSVPFYKGNIARAIVDSAQKHGGILTRSDLESYKPLWRDPLQGHYRGKTLWAVPPPAGGATLIEVLQILDARPPLENPGSSTTLHVLAEALKNAFADRAHWLGDPAFVDVPWKKLIDPVYAKQLAAKIGESARAPESYGLPPRDHGTSHLCVADGEGNVVALTTTINLGFGAKLSAAGMVLNDEMDDFVAQPGAPNFFGLVGSEANSIAPGKRPLSSMTPVVLTDEGGAVMCAGGSGGPWIVSETAQAIINVVDFGKNAEEAVGSPRIHAQWVPDILYAEGDVPSDVRDNLAKRGHKVKPPPAELGGATQVIILRKDSLEAASDPRKGGAPASP